MKRFSTMRNLVLPMLMAGLVFSSCSYNQFGAVTAGSSLGGMLGSSIGGLMGGPRGSDRGTIAGIVIGGAVGAAATAARNHPRATMPDNSSSPTYQDDAYSSSSRNDGAVSYDTYNSSRYHVASAAHSDLEDIEVTNIHFLDDNNNHRLDEGERAYIVFDIYNRGTNALYNLAPNITCSTKRVAISPAASVATVLPGQGVRYTAQIVAARRLKDAPLRFTISFGTGKQQVVVKTFEI